MRPAFGLISLAVLVAAIGCGPTEQYVGGTLRTKAYRSVVSLSPSATELLYTTQQVPDTRLMGKTASDNYPKVGYEKVPIVASVKPDYEKIAAIKPDLIVYDSSLYSDADQAKIKQLGAETFEISANTLDDFINQIFALGNLVGGETNLSDYVDRIQSARAIGKTATNPAKVAIIMPGAGGANMIAGTGSFLADVVRNSGGDPVGPKGDAFVPLDPETLVSLNPAYIVSAGDPTPILNDPRFKAVKAIAEKKVLPGNQDILLRRGCRVDLLINAIHDFVAK